MVDYEVHSLIVLNLLGPEIDLLGPADLNKISVGTRVVLDDGLGVLSVRGVGGVCVASGGVYFQESRLILYLIVLHPNILVQLLIKHGLIDHHGVGIRHQVEDGLINGARRKGHIDLIRGQVVGV